MAISFNSATNHSTTGTSDSYSFSVSGDCVLVNVRDTTGTSITGVSVGGVPLTLLAISGTASGGATMKNRLYGLMNPPTGTQTVSITASSSVSIASVIGCYSGVVSMTPFVSANDAGPSNVTSLTVTSSGIPSHSWMVMGGSDDNGGSLSASTGSTLRSDSGNGCALFDSNGLIGSSPYSMTYTGTSGHFGGGGQY